MFERVPRCLLFINPTRNEYLAIWHETEANYQIFTKNLNQMNEEFPPADS